MCVPVNCPALLWSCCMCSTLSPASLLSSIIGGGAAESIGNKVFKMSEQCNMFGDGGFMCDHVIMYVQLCPC